MIVEMYEIRSFEPKTKISKIYIDSIEKIDGQIIFNGRSAEDDTFIGFSKEAIGSEFFYSLKDAVEGLQGMSLWDAQ